MFTLVKHCPIISGTILRKDWYKELQRWDIFNAIIKWSISRTRGGIVRNGWC